MAKQTINLGDGVNNSGGDAQRDVYKKVNSNFNEVYQTMKEAAPAATDESTLLARSNHSGFDRSAAELDGGKNLGVLEFCQDASSGVYWRIDYNGAASKHTGQTTFGDGTTLADRTLVHYKASGEDDFSYWYQGELIKVTETKSFQLEEDASVYVYYDSNGDLSIATQLARPLIVREVLVSYITDTTTFGCDPYFADERHGIVMDGQTHLRLHLVDKFRVTDHGELSGVALGSSTFTEVSAGRCGDEDIPKILNAITTAPKMYKIGSNWGISDDDNKLALLDGGVTQVNSVTAGNGSLVDLTGNDRLGMVMVACNDSIHPIRIMVGQTAYANRAVARRNVPAEWERMEKDGLPSPEMTPYFTFIVKPNGVIEKGDDGEVYILNKNGILISKF